ncbi:MAG: deoxyribose-phosphate aldolase [Clostridiales bacterium]|jgi:deoxyribose-phosphate aldolase|nr:deoxyribose-phosphate aldolase [Clostridiales bacterium]
MEDSFIFSRVDHTLLRADATWAEIKALCDEAVLYKTASVCVPPSYVGAIDKEYGRRLTVCTVIGFPLGYSTRPVKEAELANALLDGAGEFDMVINLGDVKNGNFQKITDEIASLKKLAGGSVLKVIIETCCLSEEEKIKLCGCVTESGADFIKTSTGFGRQGAVLSDIALFKKYIGPEVKIKAAGGIRTREDMVAFLEAGCSRLGTSSAVKILTGGSAGDY